MGSELWLSLGILLPSEILDLELILKSIIYMVIIGVTYRYLVRPLNWNKEMESVGYSYLSKGFYSKNYGLSLTRRGRNIGRLPPVYPNGWFMIAESAEILHNQVRHVAALGENFAVFRSKDGHCHVLDAYCPHVGANMGIGGKVHGDCIECPFHHWRFSGVTGKCTHVPYASKVPTFAEVKCWKVHEVNDMIFIWYNAENEDPMWYPDQVDDVDKKKFIYRGRNQFLVNCHIQDIPENGSDIWHFTAVHGASLFGGSDIHHHEVTWLKFFRHNWSAEWEPCNEPNKKHVAIAQLSHFVTLFGKIKIASLDVDVKQIGPGYVVMYMQTSFGPMVILQTVTPIEPLVHKVVHRFYCPLMLSLFATMTIISESIMIERDIMIWNHKKFEDAPTLLKEDKPIAKYRRWFTQFYSEHSPLFNSKQGSLDW